MMDENEQPAPFDGGGRSSAEPDRPARSLQEDIAALIRDGRTYVDAEIAYQKSRADFVIAQVRKTLVLGVVGALLGILALIGLVVGVIIALGPIVGPWAACAIVVGALALLTLLALKSAQKNWQKMIDAATAGDGGRV